MDGWNFCVYVVNFSVKFTVHTFFDLLFSYFSKIFFILQRELLNKVTICVVSDIVLTFVILFCFLCLV